MDGKGRADKHSAIERKRWLIDKLNTNEDQGKQHTFHPTRTSKRRIVGTQAQARAGTE